MINTVAAKVWYDVSLADCDWLHGSAESLLTVTNLVTVVAFRQALSYKEQEQNGNVNVNIPESFVSYDPMVKLVGGLTVLAFFTAFFPAISGAEVHTPYLSGFMDIPSSQLPWVAPHPEPENALTVACWVIHVSSLVEFLGKNHYLLSSLQDGPMHLPNLISHSSIHSSLYL